MLPLLIESVAVGLSSNCAVIDFEEVMFERIQVLFSIESQFVQAIKSEELFGVTVVEKLSPYSKEVVLSEKVPSPVPVLFTDTTTVFLVKVAVTVLFAVMFEMAQAVPFELSQPENEVKLEETLGVALIVRFDP